MAGYMDSVIMLLLGTFLVKVAKTLIKDTDPSFPKKVKLLRLCGIVMMVCASILFIVKATGN